MKPIASILSKVSAKVVEAKIDGQIAPLKIVRKADTHYMGVGVRHAGDDGAAAYRIPGLVTSNKGTLLGVYDVRYNNSADLQEYVEIGLSRSTDGGQTWEKMRIPMAFGEYDGLPKAQNGVGDPAILVDKRQELSGLSLPGHMVWGMVVRGGIHKQVWTVIIQRN